MIPIWLLDVDGVLNAVNRKPPVGRGHWQHFEQKRCNGYILTWAPELIERIRALVDAGKVDIHWLTTWWNMIHELPWREWHGLQVANTEQEYRAHCEWWKLPVAQRLYQPGRKMVWTDDDLRFVRGAQDWLADKRQDVLAIAPHTMLGLSPAHMDAIDNFLG